MVAPLVSTAVVSVDGVELVGVPLAKADVERGAEVGAEVGAGVGAGVGADLEVGAEVGAEVGTAVSETPPPLSPSHWVLNVPSAKQLQQMPLSGTPSSRATPS